MQFILAPSKTMTMTRRYPAGLVATEPHFLMQAKQIVKAVQSIDDMQKTMHVSDAIAKRVVQMYAEWGDQTEPALFAYIGDVYRWFFADTLSATDVQWAQDHLFIMSGLYGVLRPLDTVSPYRLEMKAKVAVGDARDLYDFWGDLIARYVDTVPDELICNLSSDEYARVVTRFTKKQVITPVFIDNKTNGTVGTVPIYSKMMRGVMARWVIDNRIDTADQLKAFAAQGYTYAADKSTEGTVAFYRQTPKPIRL